MHIDNDLFFSISLKYRYYWVLAPSFCFLIPTLIPVVAWNESYQNAFFIAGILKYVASLHSMWLVNSYAHCYGPKPYDK